MTAFAQGVVWKSSLPHEWRYIAVAIADQTDDDGLGVYGDLSNRALQMKTGLSESTVRRRLQEMMDPEVGLVAIEKPSSHHRPALIRLRLDLIKKGSEEHWSGLMERASKRGKKDIPAQPQNIPQGCQPDTPEIENRGVNGTGQGCQRDGQGCQRDGQGCQRDGSHIRCLESPDTREAPNTHQRAREGEEEDERQKQGPSSTCLGDYEFELFWANGPWSKIPGWEVHRPKAQMEFARLPGRWRMLQRAAKLYGMSADVQRFVADGGRGVKYPHNFIRDGTWMGYQDERAVETEEQIVARKIKLGLTAKLKESPDKMHPGIEDDEKKLFYSLNTRWDFLAQMALEGRDICGPQTAHFHDAKMLAAEGAANAGV